MSKDRPRNPPPVHTHFFTKRVVTHVDKDGIEHGVMMCHCGQIGFHF